MPKSREKQRARFELDKHFQIQLARACRLSLALALGALGALGCAPVALPDGERRVALKGATDEVVLPTCAELSERASELASQLELLASDPDAADLTGTRQVYREVRDSLEEAQAFGFGPWEELHSAAALDQSPVDVAKLEAELGSDSELTPEHLRTLGANKRGLHALEYLLFPEDDAEWQSALLADDVAGQRRRQFASAAGRLVADAAEALRGAWDPETGGYARRFSQPGAADSVSATVQGGLDTLLNQCVVLSEVVANVKLGKPLGATTGGSVDPSAQESGRAGTSLRDMLGNLRGVRNIYFGARGAEASPSLSTLVRAKSPSADRHAREALSAAEAALEAVPEPLTLALSESPDSVRLAYDSLKTLKRVLATEVLGSLGASLKFSDNDGD